MKQIKKKGHVSGGVEIVAKRYLERENLATVVEKKIELQLNNATEKSQTADLL